MLRPIMAGHEVVEDYNATGLTLRPHPVSSLRRKLTRRGIVACVEAAAARDGKRLTTSGLVLVRQRPASARGVVFQTIEDETGIANIVVWPDLFEKQLRVVLSVGMIAISGRVQRESEVARVIARSLADLSPLLRSIGERDNAASRSSGKGSLQARIAAILYLTDRNN